MIEISCLLLRVDVVTAVHLDLVQAKKLLDTLQKRCLDLVQLPVVLLGRKYVLEVAFQSLGERNSPRFIKPIDIETQDAISMPLNE